MDGVVFFRLSYFDYGDLQLFAIFIVEIDFSETYLTTSAENSVSEHPDLKTFWGKVPPDPPTRLLPLALAIMPPVTKNLATALGKLISKSFQNEEGPAPKCTGEHFNSKESILKVGRSILTEKPPCLTPSLSTGPKRLSWGGSTIMEKSLGTLFRFRGVFQFIQVQPLPTPHKQCWTSVSRISFPSFNFV